MRIDGGACGHAEPRNRFLSEARHHRKNAAGVGPRRQWKKVGLLPLAAMLLATVNACGGAAPEKPAPEPAVELPALAIYVTNEASGDLTIIDGTKNTALATIPLGKRPRGIAVSPDRKFLTSR